MINDNQQYLMMIEPSGPVELPIEDELTQLAREVWGMASENDRFRGFHVCICGERSDNIEWILPTGHITNSLLVHYVRNHRGEVPKVEIDKLIYIANEIVK